MRVALSLFVGLLGIVIGYCLVAYVSYSLAGLRGMSDFEGGRAMFAAFFMGPIGAFLGFFAGCLAGWKLGNGRPTPNRLMILFLICLVATGFIWMTLVMG